MVKSNSLDHGTEYCVQDNLLNFTVEVEFTQILQSQKQKELNYFTYMKINYTQQVMGKIYCYG